MKKYALYLPQYHEIPENNKWWGKGFTEWTNVKKALPLYDNHCQPQIPLNNNYYSLNDVKTLKWQTELATMYGIDGFVFYHYYFQGKLLLNKPAEMLLKNTEISLNYFFCWANHSWFRSWQGSKELLIEQSYGTEQSWKDHFMYLLQFFKDKRYVKIDNKPVIMIFKPDFAEKNRMFSLFNKLAIENGFSGIYVIDTMSNYSDISMDSSFCQKNFFREPAASLFELKRTFKFIKFRMLEKVKRILHTKNSFPIQVIPGDWLYDIMIERAKKKENVIHGLFFEWDNTPRHSKNGYVILPVSKSKFLEYMDVISDDDLVIINAWNEWCEGMMLEPTQANRYKYLEWIKEWKSSNEK